MQKQHQVKVVLLGEAAVGKSSLVLRYVKGEFHKASESTIGAAFQTQRCRIPESNQTLKLEIWDTAGQERFATLAPIYYRNAQVAIVVFDCTASATLQKAKQWVAEVKAIGRPDCQIVLASNKSDLGIDKQVIKDAQDFATTHNLQIFQVSAKSGTNVIEMFTDIARNLVKANPSLGQELQPETPKTSRSFIFGPRTIMIRDDQEQKRGCC